MRIKRAPERPFEGPSRSQRAMERLVEYVALRGSGDLERGRTLTTASEFGFRTSVNATKFAFPPKKLSREIERIGNDVIISNEAWTRQAMIFKPLLEGIKASYEAVFYVRPHVPLLNSSWWQWGAWSGQPFGEWMDRRLKASMWSRHLENWKKIDQVKRLTVRLLPEDIVSDFYRNVLDAPAPEAQSGSVNKSLPAAVLRLFQGNPKLRPGPHGSLIDFVLSENLKTSEPAPWVLDRAWIRRILQETKAENHRLLT